MTWRQTTISAIFWTLAAAAQTPAPPQQPATEMSQHDEPATFRTHVNLVMVPVVVRDKNGKAIGTLKKEDFQIFDKGKLQEITRFNIEQPGQHEGEVKTSDVNTGEGKPGGVELPDRFIAYLFDDIHISFPDLVRTREAAMHSMTNLRSTDRAAIFTTSGQTILEFTDDREKFRETLNRLQPRPIARIATQQCPDLTYYMADLILNKNDPSATQAAVNETIACASIQGATQLDTIKMATQLMQGVARQVLSSGEQESRVALAVIRDVLHRMAGTPGQRIIVLTSPGFMAFEQYQERNDVIDRAIKANVVINALDARGLYTDSWLDASKRGGYDSVSTRIKAQIEHDSDRAQADILAEFAAGTGGTFFENNNDFNEGYHRTAEAPQFVYLLGFSPQNLKIDGSFHSLKVSLKVPGLLLIARRGYYAPKKLESAEETARQEIEEAIFSREELNDLPLQLHTQFFKTADGAKLNVIIHLDTKRLRFRKVEDRSKNELTVVAAIFDRNGNVVTGQRKVIDFRLKDATVARLETTGINLRDSFDVKPGTYLVRLVVRDAEGQMMSAANGAVEIPQ